MITNWLLNGGNVLELYILSMYLGKFIAGAVIGDIIPLIIAFIKKRWGLGIATFLLCGMTAFVLLPLLSLELFT